MFGRRYISSRANVLSIPNHRHVSICRKCVTCSLWWAEFRQRKNKLLE